MELPDADLKIGAAGKWQHFQKNFFYRIWGTSYPTPVKLKNFFLKNS